MFDPVAKEDIPKLRLQGRMVFQILHETMSLHCFDYLCLLISPTVKVMKIHQQNLKATFEHFFRHMEGFFMDLHVLCFLNGIVFLRLLLIDA